MEKHITRDDLGQIAHFARLQLKTLKHMEGTLPEGEQSLLQLCIDIEYGTSKIATIVVD